MWQNDLPSIKKQTNHHTMTRRDFLKDPVRAASFAAEGVADGEERKPLVKWTFRRVSPNLQDRTMFL